MFIEDFESEENTKLIPTYKKDLDIDKISKKLQDYCLTRHGKRLLNKQILFSNKKEGKEFKNRLKKFIKSGKENIDKTIKYLMEFKKHEDNIIYLLNMNDDQKEIFSNLIYDIPYISDFMNNQNDFLTWVMRYKIYINPLFIILGPFMSVIMLVFYSWYNNLKIDVIFLIKMLITAIAGSWELASPYSIIAIGYVVLYIYSCYNSVMESVNIYTNLGVLHEKIKSVKWLNEEIPLTICDTDNLISPKGNIIKDYYNLVYKNIIIKCKIKVLEAAEMDCLVACYKMLDKGNYSFAKKGKKLKIKQMFNPLIYINIVNDYNGKSSVITGVNASGKTSYLKNIGICECLSQSLGIVPAQKYVTPGFNIYTVFRVTDVINEASLFEAESTRYFELIKKTEADQNTPNLILLDELLSSTNFVEGYSLAKVILERLIKNKLNTVIFTTHFHGLASIKIQKLCFSNDNSYKVNKGINREYYAIELLKNKDWDKEIIKRATAEKNKLVREIDNIFFK